MPERFERQSQPPHLEQLRQPLEGRLLRALKPVRGPVRAVDIAETKQEPSQYPAGYALADAAGDKHFDDKIPLASEDVTQNADEPMDDQDSTTRSPEVADSPETASNDVSHPPRRKHPMPEYVDPEPGGIWTDPGPPSAVTASTSASTAAAPNVENKEKKAADEDESRTGETREPGILENQEEIHPQGPGTQAQAMKTYHEALRMASAVSEERNHILDGLPPRRQVDGQPAPKQPRLDEVHMVQMTTEDELFAVVESRLDAAGKQAFKEAKIKSSVAWCENDAFMERFLLRYKDNEPHARVILQGFKHRDVLEAKLDTESPTCHDLASTSWSPWPACFNGRLGRWMSNRHSCRQGRLVWGALGRNAPLAEGNNWTS